jgi:hypothetical protein
MSDFFSGVYGARFPDLVMNSGPLPPTGGLPAPLHDVADARINYNSTLLGDLDPYAYGEPGYQSSQVSYVNHPHRIYKLVPPVRLPEPQVNTCLTFEVSHCVDDSDLAFAMRLDRSSTVCAYLGSKQYSRSRTGTTVDAFVNLATLNYILAGLQLCYRPGNPSSWFNMLYDLDKTRFETNDHVLGLEDIVHIVRNLIRPFGIVRGSEKQGGQDEVGLSPATWPVNFVCTMVIDGKDRNVVNMWHHHDISAGDDLVLRLKPMPIPKGRDCYTLNHYYKRFVQKSFETFQQAATGHTRATHVWQLVPDIFSLDIDKTPAPGAAPPQMPRGLEVPDGFAWQEWGYWHIARSQIMFRKYSEAEYYNNDMANQLKANHLDLTFAPTWQRVPGAKYEKQALAAPAGAGGAVYAVPGTDKNSYRQYVRKGAGVRGGIDGLASAMPAAAEPWAPRLGLEHMRAFLSAPMPPPPPPAASLQACDAFPPARAPDEGYTLPWRRAAAAAAEMPPPAPAPAEMPPPAPAPAEMPPPEPAPAPAAAPDPKRRKKAGV